MATKSKSALVIIESSPLRLFACFLVSLILMPTLGCGERNKDGSKDQIDDSTQAVLPRASERRSPSGSSKGFGLVNAEFFKIQVDSCVSGYTYLVTEQNPQVKVYKGDSNCLAKLTEFTNADGTYIPLDGQGFSTYQKGDTATFINGNLETVDVVVVSQFSNPTAVTDRIDFRIDSTASNGNDVNLLDVTQGVSGKFSAIDQAPNFKVESMKLSGGDPASQSGIFEVILSCTSKMKVQNSRGTTTYICGQVSVEDMQYTLVKDTYNDQPCSPSIGSAGCDQIMTEGVIHSVDVANEIILPGSTLKSGGVKLAAITGGMVGPNDMANNPNMLILLERAGSYQYFNVDINVSLGLMLHQMALYGLEAERDDGA